MRPPASHDSTMFCAIWVCGPAAGPNGVAARRHAPARQVERGARKKARYGQVESGLFSAPARGTGGAPARQKEPASAQSCLPAANRLHFGSTHRHRAKSRFHRAQPRVNARPRRKSWRPVQRHCAGSKSRQGPRFRLPRPESRCAARQAPARGRLRLRRRRWAARRWRACRRQRPTSRRFHRRECRWPRSPASSPTAT